MVITHSSFLSDGSLWVWTCHGQVFDPWVILMSIPPDQSVLDPWDSGKEQSPCLARPWCGTLNKTNNGVFSCIVSPFMLLFLTHAELPSAREACIPRCPVCSASLQHLKRLHRSIATARQPRAFYCNMPQNRNLPLSSLSFQLLITQQKAFKSSYRATMLLILILHPKQSLLSILL